MSSKQQPQFDTVIIRLGGEIGIKAAWTRKFYERHLASNIKATLKQHVIPYETLNRRFGRFFLKTSQAQNASEKLAKVFGISSVSPAFETSSKLSDISQHSVRIAGLMLKERSSFAVACRRVGEHSYSSQDVCREVGRQILDTYSKRRLRVDLKHPEATVYVEVREDKAYVSTEVIKGPGGLPLGSQPKIVCLLNEDIKSLVACWMVMKRGCPIILLHFEEAHSKKEKTTQTVEAAQALLEWAVGFPRRVYIVSHSQNTVKTKQKTSAELRQILSKRVMYRVAERIAEMEHAEGIVTGDSLEDSASTELHVIHLEEEAANRFPIHRPLIGLDASEILGLAEKIRTQEESSISTKEKRKVTSKLLLGKVTLEQVKDAEAKLPIERMVEASVKSLRTITF